MPESYYVDGKLNFLCPEGAPVNQIYSMVEPSSLIMPADIVMIIELVVTTVESVRDSKSEHTSLLNDTIVRVKL